MSEVVKVSSGNRIRLPEKVASEAGIKAGDYVQLDVKAGCIQVRRLNLLP